MSGKFYSFFLIYIIHTTEYNYINFFYIEMKRKKSDFKLHRNNIKEAYF